MPRRYRRGYSRYGHQRSQPVNREALEHVRQYHELARRLGPIVEDVKTALFELDEIKRARLLDDYRGLYGDSAADYATEAFNRWRTGATKMSGQTAERMLNLVPKYLTQNQRYEIVRRLCDHHKKFLYRSVHVDPQRPADSLPTIKDALTDIAQTDELSHLPEQVVETATWLHDADIVAARAVLAEVDRRRQIATAESIARQWPNIEVLLRTDSVKEYSETFEFPTGELKIYAHKSSSCFVATAVYGDANHQDVVLLRTYRDKVLATRACGRSVVRAYYVVGPYLAAIVEHLPFLRPLFRFLLERLAVLTKRRFE